MKVLMRISGAALLVFMQGCALIPVPQKIGDVHFAGCVYDRETRKPIHRASVLVNYPMSVFGEDRVLGEVKTGEDGCFVFEPAPEFAIRPLGGPIEVRVYASGYRTYFLPLSAVAGMTDLIIRMNEAPRRYP